MDSEATTAAIKSRGMPVRASPPSTSPRSTRGSAVRYRLHPVRQRRQPSYASRGPQIGAIFIAYTVRNRGEEGTSILNGIWAGGADIGARVELVQGSIVWKHGCTRETNLRQGTKGNMDINNRVGCGSVRWFLSVLDEWWTERPLQSRKSVVI